MAVNWKETLLLKGMRAGFLLLPSVYLRSDHVVDCMSTWCKIDDMSGESIYMPYYSYL